MGRKKTLNAKNVKKDEGIEIDYIYETHSFKNHDERKFQSYGNFFKKLLEIPASKVYHNYKQNEIIHDDIKHLKISSNEHFIYCDLCDYKTTQTKYIIWHIE